MCPGVDFLQLSDTYFSINLCDLQFFVTKQLLDEADIRAAFKHMCGTGMPEQVTTAAPTDVSLTDVFGDLAAEGLCGLKASP